jgi:hypothetical protein
MGEWTFAVSFTLLLVGLPVGVAFGLAETTGSRWAVLIGIIVTAMVSFSLLVGLLDTDSDQTLLGVGIAAVGLSFAVLGILGALLDFNVIAIGPKVTEWAGVGPIVAIVGLVLAMLGVHRSLP